MQVCNPRIYQSQVCFSLSKKPNMLAKEPCMSAKDGERRFGVASMQSLHLSISGLFLSLKRAQYACKRALYVCKRALYVCKRALYFLHKRPTFHPNKKFASIQSLHLPISRLFFSQRTQCDCKSALNVCKRALFSNQKRPTCTRICQSQTFLFLKRAQYV